MYENWRITRWETPVVDIHAVALVSLIDNVSLEVTVEATRMPGRPRWRFVFDRVAAYRNILEEYRLELWGHLDESGQRCGFTFTVQDSPWIAELRPNEPLLELYNPGLQHYVLCTDDDVIEVLSAQPVRVQAAESAPPDSPTPGKATHLYPPEDRGKIEKLLEDLRRRMKGG